MAEIPLDIPDAWSRALARILSEGWRRILVAGATDRGKSSYCKFLVNALLQEGQKVSFVDADIGQKDVGPPATVTLTDFDAPTDFAQATSRGMYFVGHISPFAHFPLVVGARQMVEAARGAFVVIDTAGLVQGITAAYSPAASSTPSTPEPQASPRRTSFPRKGKSIGFESYRYVQIWIPAFAGMTHTTNSASIPCTRLSKTRDGIDDIPGLKPARHPAKVSPVYGGRLFAPRRAQSSRNLINSLSPIVWERGRREGKLKPCNQLASLFYSFMPPI